MVFESIPFKRHNMYSGTVYMFIVYVYIYIYIYMLDMYLLDINIKVRYVVLPSSEN